MSEIKEKATPTPDEKAALEPLVKRLTAVFTDAMNQEMVKFKADLDAQRERIVKENEELLEKALRASLGVEKDQPVMLSQVSEVVRKALLEQTETQKRTPAPEMAKAGSDAPKADPFDLKLKEKGLEA